MSDINRIAIVGAGAWGTALAKHLSEKGLLVHLWAYEREVVDSIRSTRENRLYLPAVPLPRSLAVTNSLGEAIQDCQGILFVVPSHVARQVLQRMAPLIEAEIPVISATKGVEEDTYLLMSRVMEDVLPVPAHRKLMVLSGPSFASEVGRGQPTALCLAGGDAQLVSRFQAAFMTSSLRVYADSDMIGVQLGGALKNVMALAAGVVDGLELGFNTRAALITRGLAEMVRLGTAMGADARTFYGLSGVGDLVLTCTGTLSRNHSVGARLGKGEKLDTILGNMHAVAEGVRTARAALGMARRARVEMPIVQEINAVLFEGKSCRRAVSDLMERVAKPEKGLP
ncbi:Glycerol-3-phosphate dehydrogenase [NAD(P)+] [Nitrospira sp. KM1]|uniref:NAD(P)H-dependent glycerol-3-phosphate dehydrogenase n=1 Tax=Nitrospira sp. KM1 TaxID=1936990 RepID=UPI0013A7588D|nr:NAD(P)H-dependent glycerol-3-phosphate dehydrogenase [Nitrospira sp. KM1]BCA55682.1 Glycerol-3-phosphate dehydrogenase [NAD(P)+] [Nitrospira sp. KM1]